MEEKKYLKWYNKIGYGSGDIAGNVVYAFLTSFMMPYLTDSVGLAAGVVGTLIAVSKLFDGFTDIFFGSMIDKTHSKMGKAKPWMLYGYIGCAITLVCCFTVPVSLGTTAKYAWFFISYTLLNGVFYTANNIAYSALTSLITKNTGIDKVTVLATVEAFMDAVKASLSKDENVYLRGFGSFVVKKRAQKTARNISKNTTIIIPEHNIPAFKPAKTFTLSVKK